MRKSARLLAIGAAVAAGPLIAMAASTVGDYIYSGHISDEEDFSLDAAFISPGEGLSSQSCSTAQFDAGTCIVTGGSGGGGIDGDGWENGWGYFGGGHNTDTGSDSGDRRGAPPPSDCEKLSIDTTLDSSDPMIASLLAKLSEQYHIALQRLGNLPSTSRFVLRDGSSVSASEIYRLLSRADFIVDTDTADWSSFGRAGSRGVIFYNGGDPVYRIRASYLQQFLASEEGAQFYIFHEISHVTSAGNARSAADYDPNSEGGREQTLREMAETEHWTNAFQLAIRSAMGFAPSPGHFTESERQSAPTYDPGHNSFGATVSQTATCS
jgi:hypothetical protein